MEEMPEDLRTYVLLVRLLARAIRDGATISKSLIEKEVMQQII